MGYTPSFTPQYENGWEDLPIEETPITAEALNAYDDAIENIEDYLASDESQANLADAYDETATYEAGDYVIYNGDLYKCLEDIDTPEEWDSTKWESCLITDEMATSGGTTVIANPSGQATDTLTKLQVENTIYGISGGGGNANIWTGTQAELEEVFDELEDGTQINITDDEQEVVEGGTIYSEEEQVIGLWKNNKPLYQKTFVTEKTNIVGNSDIDITSDIDAISIDEIIAYNNHLLYTYTSGSSTVTGEYWSDDLARLAVVSNGYVIRLTIGGATLNTVKVTWTITYTKTTDAPLDAVVGKKTMYIASSDCYSTEEKEIGCYIDGKPLYQKTIDCGALPNNTTKEVAHGISNVDRIVELKGTSYSTTNGFTLPLEDIDGGAGITSVIRLYANNTNIYLATKRDQTVYDKTLVTLCYTKTTDTAGSGQYTPASGKAVHYSTDEQVIGTYVDGKPIYRKSFTYSSGSLSTGSLTLTNDLSNVERVIDKHCQFHGGSDNRDYDIPYFRIDYNESVFLLCHVLTDNTVTTALVSGDHSSYTNLTDIVLTLEYTKTV